MNWLTTAIKIRCYLTCQKGFRPFSEKGELSTIYLRSIFAVMNDTTGQLQKSSNESSCLFRLRWSSANSRRGLTYCNFDHALICSTHVLLHRTAGQDFDVVGTRRRSLEEMQDSVAYSRIAVVDHIQIIFEKNVDNNSTYAVFCMPLETILFQRRYENN